MLVKIDPVTYIQTDHITSLIVRGNVAVVNYLSHDPMEISEAAAAYILLLMEANEAFLTPEELAQQPAQPLTSIVAQTLRDQFPNGATYEQLDTAIELEREGFTDAAFALNELINEKIVTRIGDLFYHATNAPITKEQLPFLPEPLDNAVLPIHHYTCAACGVQNSAFRMQVEYQTGCAFCEALTMVPALTWAASEILTTASQDLSGATVAPPLGSPAEYNERLEDPKSFD